MSEGHAKGKEEEEQETPSVPGFIDYAPTPMAKEVLGEEDAHVSAMNFARESSTRHYPALMPDVPGAPKKKPTTTTPRQERAALHDKTLMMLAIGTGTGLAFGVLAGWFLFSPVK